MYLQYKKRITAGLDQNAAELKDTSKEERDEQCWYIHKTQTNHYKDRQNAAEITDIA